MFKNKKTLLNLTRALLGSTRSSQLNVTPYAVLIKKPYHTFHKNVSLSFLRSTIQSCLMKVTIRLAYHLFLNTIQSY